jgi:hypothetical protein
VPIWVRDFTRKVQQNDIDLVKFHTTSARSSHSGLLIGIMVLLLLFTFLGLLIYLAVAAQEMASVNCGILPPCY